MTARPNGCHPECPARDHGVPLALGVPRELEKPPGLDAPRDQGAPLGQEVPRELEVPPGLDAGRPSAPSPVPKEAAFCSRQEAKQKVPNDFKWYGRVHRMAGCGSS